MLLGCNDHPEVLKYIINTLGTNSLSGPTKRAAQRSAPQQQIGEAAPGAANLARGGGECSKPPLPGKIQGWDFHGTHRLRMFRKQQGLPDLEI